jgi:hypothetical protein
MGLIVNIYKQTPIYTQAGKKQGVTKRDKKITEGFMAETAMKTAPYVPSVTSVTKRDKRDKSHLGNRRDSVTTHPVGVLSCHAYPGPV